MKKRTKNILKQASLIGHLARATCVMVDEKRTTKDVALDVIAKGQVEAWADDWRVVRIWRTP